MNNKNNTRCSILELSAEEVNKYFLEDDSYCSFDLPPYIVFKKILLGINKFFKNKKISDCCKTDPKECQNVNHIIYSNKDGKYAWRPLQLIHPVLYVSLVNEITNSV